VITAISSVTGFEPTGQAVSNPTQSAPAKQPEDSVHLSPQAKAQTAGDVDHDGDSH
jgi:hypothetical protein